MADKRIGILTSGGDCAGLNAVVRAAVHRARLTYGWKIFGIEDGTVGVLERPLRFQELDVNTFDGRLLREGGTFLGTTNKGNPFAYPMPDGTLKDRSMEIVDGFRMLKLDALIVIGGDGSQAIVRKICQQGDIKIVGIPKTIDNDVGATEFSVGFQSAVNVATEALDRLQPTAASHQRVMVVEVMGRDAGHIALNSGIAGGADAILIPEIPVDLQLVADHIKAIRRGGRNFSLVVVAESVTDKEGNAFKQALSGGEMRYGGVGAYVGAKLSEMTGAETRVTVLGHVQRGGSPTPLDRVIATAFGVHAVDLIAQEKFDRMVVWRNREVQDVFIEDAIKEYGAVDVDGPLVRAGRGVGVCFGDQPVKWLS
ncbi:ATP-dependent 6-phosphofructokinase [Radicibacter daui]|uniref:ATP-dependent 6-phosphofructokinase n=1 Tax=Radicibacter daui TaxID=3064829 RepID=UPI004046C709